MSVSSDDINLFKSMNEGTVEIETNNVIPGKRKPDPIPRQSLQDERLVLQECLTSDPDILLNSSGDELFFYRPGLQKSTIIKLKKGKYKIEAELDLHGLRSNEAKSRVNDFISNCLSNSKYCIKIIHGKGHGSYNKMPVLKNKVAKWLSLDNRVLGYCSARPNDGGTGAVYVLLRLK